MTQEPGPANAYLAAHAGLLLRAYRHWTRRDLLDQRLAPVSAAQALYEAGFAVLSHDTRPDPCFTYANLTAQRLFERPWQELVGLPSRLSAEPLAREEREHLLARVTAHGYIDDYDGVRIARSGRRFRIHAATVWNLLDDQGRCCGQAAAFSNWLDI